MVSNERVSAHLDDSTMSVTALVSRLRRSGSMTIPTEVSRRAWLLPSSSTPLQTPMDRLAMRRLTSYGPMDPNYFRSSRRMCEKCCNSRRQCEVGAPHRLLQIDRVSD